jgi:predicted MFS family arabinose efflux permease
VSLWTTPQPAPVSDSTGSELAAHPEIALHHDPRLHRVWAYGLVIYGTRWMEALAFGVFAFQQTQSALWVASMMLLRMLPLSLFGLPLSLLAERVSRRQGMVVMQCLSSFMYVVLVALALAGALAVWHVALASFLGGLVWAADNCFRRSLMGDMAGAPRMARAMALDSVVNNLCRLAGPALGGLLLAHAGGMVAVFGLAAVANAMALVAAWGLPRDRPLSAVGAATYATAPPTAQVQHGVWPRVVGAFQAAAGNAPLRGTLWVTALFNLFCWPVLSMVPVIGQVRLGLGTQGVGLLGSMDGLGALLCALTLVARPRGVNEGRWYLGGMMVYLGAVPLFAWSPWAAITSLALVLMGFAQASFAVMQTTLTYALAPPHQRVQAMGLLTLCVGTAPLGFLWLGSVAQWLGAPTACLISAGAGAAALALTQRIWRPCLVPVGSAVPA